MRKLFVTVALGLAAFGLLALAPSSADGHPPLGYGGYGGYYGNGGHDFAPHWHQTYTPYGSYSYYGIGAHDFMPHDHSFTPYSYQGYHYTPRGYTESYYSTPYGYYSPYYLPR
jgi:hypothetical protein